jgi:hypothetical protein
MPPRIVPGVHNSDSSDSLLRLVSTIQASYKDAVLEGGCVSGEITMLLISVKSESIALFILSPDHGDLEITVKIDGKPAPDLFSPLKLRSWAGHTIKDVVENDTTRVITRAIGSFIEVTDDKKYEISGSNSAAGMDMSFKFTKLPKESWKGDNLILKAAE